MLRSPRRWLLSGAALLASGLYLSRMSSAAPATASTFPDGPSTALARDEAPPRARGSLTSPAEVEKIASYRLEARLDEKDHRVIGRGTIRWKNASQKPAEELYFHLYLEAFRSERSLFLRSPHRRSRTGSGLGQAGGLEVERLHSPRYGDIDLWANAEPHSPGDPEDTTDIRVPLPAPVLPGETLDLEVAFTAQLPRVVERTGFAESFHLVAQWYPKLARREPDGRWAHFAFHPFSEFYADFGDYDVTLDVPREYIVGATGRLVESRVESARRVERYVAEGVHDFAWAAWDGFETEQRRIGEVDVRLLAPPGTRAARDVTWQTLEHALPFFGERFGRYPYPTLTVVHPPAFARGTGGMEYPTFITTGGSTHWPRLGIRSIEQVTVHELAHQWFQGMLASNESAYPFLDEGLTSYAEWAALEAQFGPGSMVDLLGLRLSDVAVGRAVTLRWGRDEPIAQPASAFTSMRSLAAHVYSGTATIFETLRRVYGDEALERALRDYALRFRLAHPTPDDLLESIRQHLGDSAAEALRTLLYERGTVDFAVTELQSARRTPQAGTTPGEWHNRVVVVRRGTVKLPVTIQLELEGGRRIERRWDGQGPLITLESVDEAAVRRVVVDPERRVLLDENLLNNVRSAEGPGRAPRTSQRLWYWTELLLHALGS